MKRGGAGDSNSSMTVDEAIPEEGDEDDTASVAESSISESTKTSKSKRQQTGTIGFGSTKIGANGLLVC